MRSSTLAVSNTDVVPGGDVPLEAEDPVCRHKGEHQASPAGRAGGMRALDSHAPLSSEVR